MKNAAGLEEAIDADAVVFSVGISGLQRIVSLSKQLAKRSEFRNTLNLASIDVMAVRIYFDRKINVEFASNACFGFHETTGWTYFDLNSLHDEYRDAPKTVIEADFYHSNQMMPMHDRDVVDAVLKMLKVAEKAFAAAEVDDYVVVRVPRGVTRKFNLHLCGPVQQYEITLLWYLTSPSFNWRRLSAWIVSTLYGSEDIFQKCVYERR